MELSKVGAAAQILMIVQNLPVPFDRRVWQEGMALRDAGYSVAIICPSDAKHPAGRHVIDGIEVVRYRAPREGVGLGGYVLEYAWALAAILAHSTAFGMRRTIKVIHICNPPDFLFLAAMPAKWLTRSALIFDQHDLGPELVKAKHWPFSRALQAVARFWERCTYLAADHVIATNESYRGVALSRGRKIPSDVTVVRSAPRKEWIVASAPSREWHRGRRFLIGYVGVIGRQEGIEYLLEATRILRDRGIDLHVALVGGGPDLERLQAMASKLGVADYVEFHGRLPDVTLRSVLSNADVCVNPDEVNELNNVSTMNKIVEYMALGRAIVQFDVTEGRFSAGRSSLYAEANDAASFADAIEVLLLHPSRARTMGEIGRRRFESELSWEAQIPQLLRAYGRVLNGR